jgi:hypothetical protein
MARKIKQLDNPYGLVQKKHWVVQVKGGERTHVYDKRTGVGLCGAGAHRDGTPIKGAILHKKGVKVARQEVDCLRCIKILKLDPGLTGKPTTVKYKGGKPVESDSEELIVRRFKPSGKGKRSEHVMVVGGRAGDYIGKRFPADDRNDPEEMSRLEDRRGYDADEIGYYGPHKVTADLHNFRRGSDRHPTQTVESPYNWFSRRVPGVVPAPGRRAVAVRPRANPAPVKRKAAKAKKKSRR